MIQNVQDGTGSQQKNRDAARVSVSPLRPLTVAPGEFYVPRVQTLPVLKSNEIDKTEQFVNVTYE